jgi:hypothetical protein
VSQGTDTSYEEALAEAAELGLMTPGGQATNYAQCAACERVFTTPGNFDRHRRGGECVDPFTIGMEINRKGAWRPPFRGEGFVSDGSGAPTGLVGPGVA